MAQSAGGAFLLGEDYTLTGAWVFTNSLTVTGTLTDTGSVLASPTISGTVAGGASYTAPTLTGPTITGPTVTGTVAGAATYTTPTLASPVVTTPTITGGTIDSTMVITGANIFFNKNTFVAAGTMQSDAVAMSLNAPGTILVTGADGTKGARLVLASAGGLVYFIKNADADNAILNVYPATGDAINALGANNPIAMAAKTSAIFMCVAVGTWLTIPLVPS